jgi:hypothetical protein
MYNAGVVVINAEVEGLDPEFTTTAPGANRNFRNYNYNASAVLDNIDRFSM